LQNHSRRRFQAITAPIGNVRAKISSIHQAGTESAHDFGFDGSILLQREKTTTNAALICDDNDLEAVRF